MNGYKFTPAQGHRPPVTDANDYKVYVFIMARVRATRDDCYRHFCHTPVMRMPIWIPINCNELERYIRRVERGEFPVTIAAVNGQERQDQRLSYRA